MEEIRAPFATLEPLEPEPAPVAEPELDALGYLQSVYRGRRIAEGPRMRAAIACLPFERPRLTLNARVSGFGRNLERAIASSGKQVIVDAKSNSATSARSP